MSHLYKGDGNVKDVYLQIEETKKLAAYLTMHHKFINIKD
jgi:hypothetical protein